MLAELVPEHGLKMLAGAEPLVPYERVLRGAMERAIAAHGSIRAAASHLGMPKSTFADRAQRWGLLPRERPRLPYNYPRPRQLK